MLERLAQTLEHFLATYGYFAIFILMFVEEAGLPLPLPNEVALMYVGYLSSKGELNANIAGLVATLGAAGGSGLLYTLSRRGGRPLLRRFSRFIHIQESRLDDAERWVARFGPISVPVARLLPGLRIYTTVIAGILRVPYKIVIAAVVGASLIWSFFWIHLGRALGDRWEEGARTFERAGRWGIAGLIVIVATILLVRWLIRRRRGVGAGHGPAPDADAEPEAQSPVMAVANEPEAQPPVAAVANEPEPPR